MGNIIKEMERDLKRAILVGFLLFILLTTILYGLKETGHIQVKAKPDIIELYIESYTEVQRDWSETGANPWLDQPDQPTNYLSASAKNLIHEYFDVQNLVGASSINSVTLCSYLDCQGEKIRVEEWDGSLWFVHDYSGSGYQWHNTTITSELDTIAKVNATRIRVTSRAIGGWTGTVYADCVLIKIDYEPTAPPNDPPVNDQCSILDRTDTDNLYAQKQLYTIDYDGHDEQGFADIDYIEVRFKTDGTTRVAFRYDEDDDLFSITVGSTQWTIDGSSTATESGNNINLTIKIMNHWDSIEEAGLNIECYIVDDEPESDLDTMQSNYVDVVTNLVTSSIECNDTDDPDRVDINAAITFDFVTRYADDPLSGSPSTSYPPDAEYNSISVYNSGDVNKGTDNTIVNGAGSVDTTAESTVKSEDYNLYIDMSDADYTDGEESETESVICDRISVSFNVDENNPINNQQVNFTVSMTRDYDSSSVTVYVYDIYRNETVFLHFHTISTFNDTNSDMKYIYDFWNCTDQTYNLKEFVDPANITVNWDDPPINFQCSIPNRDDGDNLYAQRKLYTIDADFYDSRGYDDIFYVDIRFKTDGTIRVTFRFVEDNNTFSLPIGSDKWTIDASSSYNKIGTDLNLTIKIADQWDAIEEADLNIEVYSVDKHGKSDLDTMQTSYVDVVTNLLCSSIECNSTNDPDRVDISAPITFDFVTRYANDPLSGFYSTRYPPDAEYNSISVYNSGDENKGTDNTILNGAGSVDTTAEPTVKFEDYNIYIDMADADYTDGEEILAESVISDRILVNFTVDENNPINNQQVNFTVTMKRDYDKSDVTNYVYDIYRNETIFLHFHTISTFNDTNSDAKYIYDFWNCTDQTLNLKVFVDPANITVTWGVGVQIFNRVLIGDPNSTHPYCWLFLRVGIMMNPDTSTFDTNIIYIDPLDLNIQYEYDNVSGLFNILSDPNGYTQLESLSSRKNNVNDTYFEIRYLFRIFPNNTKEEWYNVRSWVNETQIVATDDDTFNNVFQFGTVGAVGGISFGGLIMASFICGIGIIIFSMGRRRR